MFPCGNPTSLPRRLPSCCSRKILTGPNSATPPAAKPTCKTSRPAPSSGSASAPSASKASSAPGATPPKSRPSDPRNANQRLDVPQTSHATNRPSQGFIPNLLSILPKSRQSCPSHERHPAHPPRSPPNHRQRLRLPRLLRPRRPRLSPIRSPQSAIRNRISPPAPNASSSSS